jgi:5-methylcytosine-specific restriction protein A
MVFKPVNLWATIRAMLGRTDTRATPEARLARASAFDTMPRAAPGRAGDQAVRSWSPAMLGSAMNIESNAGARYDAQRESAAKRGYGKKWQAAREQWLAAHPLCQCRGVRRRSASVADATVVDHRVPHKGDLKLFWDRKNWQSMAKECHDRKTAREDGGFGRPRG